MMDTAIMLTSSSISVKPTGSTRDIAGELDGLGLRLSPGHVDRDEVYPGGKPSCGYGPAPRVHGILSRHRDGVGRADSTGGRIRGPKPLDLALRHTARGRRLSRDSVGPDVEKNDG